MFLDFFKRKDVLFLLCLTLVLLGLHLHIIDNPSKGRTLDNEGNAVQATGFNPAYHYEGEILDERHYITEANSIINEDKLLHAEHPTLGKLFIAAGITIFGDNEVGWRIFPILFSIVSVILFYFICSSLTKRRDIPIIATLIFAFENMTFILGSVAMLDVFGLTFMMASFLAFLKSRHIEGGILLALGANAKIPAAFGIITIAGFWLISRLLLSRYRKSPSAFIILGAIHPPVQIAFGLPRTKQPSSTQKEQEPHKTDSFRQVLKFLIVAPLAFMALMPFFDWLATNDFSWPWDRLDFMRHQMESLTFSNVDDSRIHPPWEWIVLPLKMSFWYHPKYTAAVSWDLWGLIMPAMLYAIYGTIRKQPIPAFCLGWIVGTWAIWLPIYFITDRIMFVFYFYPTVGAVCLMVALAISQILQYASRRQNRKLRWAIRIPVIGWGISHMVLFVLMGPILL